MIISASRRTDIPAFYAEWFLRRIQAGYCCVPNPFNANQVSRISLLPQDVDAIVFWTRNPRPMMPLLPTLDALGYQYLFLYTLLDYPHWLEKHSQSVDASIQAFRDLANQIGAKRVIWRYDPLVFTPSLDYDYHRAKFSLIAQALAGYTTFVKVSVMDDYAKTRRRLARISNEPFTGKEVLESEPGFAELMCDLVRTAHRHDMDIQSCAETLNLHDYGIGPGKCIDDRLLNRLFGLQLPSKKDPSQRPQCQCAVSKDIGMYNSCLYGCQYCYATSSFASARARFEQHNPNSESLIVPNKQSYK